ncbi:MAG: mechanosensitive ion channel [Nostocaceae cyanobacterium CSU_2_110]|nr:mechanosensitive ion channel [Nostocaceae cyanobacterium CSU_2_110]
MNRLIQNNVENILNQFNIPSAWHKPIYLGIWIALIWLLGKFIRARITKSSLDNDTSYKAKKAIVFASYLIFIIATVILYSSSLSGFTVALGVAGAGIAFALQEVIASFAGWLALLFGNFYKPGDRVQLGGIKGDVIDIGILRTTLMEMGNWVDGDLYNGRIVRIANSFVFKEPVFNYSGDFPFLWDEIKIPIRYGSDFELARSICKSTVQQVTKEYSAQASVMWSTMTKKYRVEKATTEPIVSLVANDNWIEFTIRYVVDFKRRRATKDALFTGILNEVAQTNGKVQFASATFELTTLPPIIINTDKQR